jgi:small subunit ribosomal protein S5
MATTNRAEIRTAIHERIRRKVKGNGEKPRLAIYRSLNHIYAQLIDDQRGQTIVSASSTEKDLRSGSGGNLEAARRIGQAIAERALAKGIDSVVFDRGGYLYHGRIKALTDAARAAGLNKHEVRAEETNGEEPQAAAAPEAKAEKKSRKKSKEENMRQPKVRIPAQGLDLKDQVISINRVTKVVKGGKNLSFAALVVVGDEGGHVGFGTGKAREVPLAIKKGIESAKKNLIRVPLINNTLPHQLIGEYGAGRVLVKPASEGTGVIAGGAVRAVMQAVGVRDVRTKVLGSTNPHNVVRATFDALLRMKDPIELARLRGKQVDEM